MRRTSTKTCYPNLNTIHEKMPTTLFIGSAASTKSRIASSYSWTKNNFTLPSLKNHSIKRLILQIIIPRSLKRTFELQNTAENSYYFTIMSHGRRMSTTAPLTSQWSVMIVQSFVSWLVYTFSFYWRAPCKRIKWDYIETMGL